MTDSNDFWTSLQKAQDAALQRSDAVGRVRDRMPLRAPSPRRRSPLVFVLPAAVMVAALGGAWSLTRSEPAPLAFKIGSSSAEGRSGEWIAADTKTLPVRFSDGTALALDPGSRARVVDVQATGARVYIERGHATVNVVHKANARWQLDAGPFQVSVVGTQFDIDWDPAKEELKVALRAGAVLVGGSFLAQPVLVSEGQVLIASSRDARAEIIETRRRAPQGVAAGAAGVGALDLQRGASVNPTIAAEAPKSAPLAATAPLPSSAPEPSWEALASRGKYRAALDAAVRLGFEAECRRSSGDQLMVLGDAARLSGDAGRATLAYVAARSKPESAARAAYALGLIAFDQRRNFREAARWFKVYLDESPRGALAREALGRRMEALQRGGEAPSAKQAAIQYLSSYPSGSYARLARELVAR